MTIGIDIRILGGRRRSGIIEYAEQLVSHLIKSAPEHTIKLFYSSLRHRLPEYEWLNAPNVELHSFHIPNNLLFLSNRLFGWPHIDAMIGGTDVFFSPHFFNVALSDRCRRVTTFHDLSYLRFPEFFTVGKRLWHHAMNPIRQARLSDRVIAVSASTKSDLIDYYHIDPANISVVYSGVEIAQPTPDQLNQFAKQHSIPARYIFCLSTLEPRKNIIGVICALARLKEQPGFEDCWLIIGGESGWLNDDLLDEINFSPVKSFIRLLGYVSDADRACYYSLASVFAYPSFFEGFGFPVLEAMTCETPVLTSANSSLPEVAGDSALLINPYNISDIAHGLELLLTDESLREMYVQKGRTRAAEFTWNRCVRETLAILTKD